jgi:hypothetical protein
MWYYDRVAWYHNTIHLKPLYEKDCRADHALRNTLFRLTFASFPH